MGTSEDELLRQFSDELNQSLERLAEGQSSPAELEHLEALAERNPEVADARAHLTPYSELELHRVTRAAMASRPSARRRTHRRIHRRAGWAAVGALAAGLAWLVLHPSRSVKLEASTSVAAYDASLELRVPQGEESVRLAFRTASGREGILPPFDLVEGDARVWRGPAHLFSDHAVGEVQLEVRDTSGEVLGRASVTVEPPPMMLAEARLVPARRRGETEGKVSSPAEGERLQLSFRTARPISGSFAAHLRRMGGTRDGEVIPVEVGADGVLRVSLGPEELAGAEGLRLETETATLAFVAVEP